MVDSLAQMHYNCLPLIPLPHCKVKGHHEDIKTTLVPNLLWYLMPLQTDKNSLSHLPHRASCIRIIFKFEMCKTKCSIRM